VREDTIVPMLGSIANDIYAAIGVRVIELPITFGGEVKVLAHRRLVSPSNHIEKSIRIRPRGACHL